MNVAPFYLKEYTKSIEVLPGFEYNDWLKDLTWKGQLFFNREKYFQIYFEGIKREDGLIINKDRAPLRIFAKNINFNKEILLFDEQTNGIKPLLIEKIYFDGIVNKILYLDNDENSLFEVFIWSNTSTDFIDEFQFDNDGKISLLNGEKVDIEYLNINAFDAFGIILRNVKNEYIQLVELELT
ncbi:MAG: hypothetical protein LBU73_00200 [Helicobacteraceae bacterium]|jgi:hypothetical protein|nr:hypothetical protein [Helicobacteraceae bacterium]